MTPKFYSRGVSVHTKVLSGTKHTFIYTLISISLRLYINAQKISDTVVLSMKIWLRFMHTKVTCWNLFNSLQYISITSYVLWFVCLKMFLTCWQMYACIRNMQRCAKHNTRSSVKNFAQGSFKYLMFAFPTFQQKILSLKLIN